MHKIAFALSLAFVAWLTLLPAHSARFCMTLEKAKSLDPNAAKIKDFQEVFIPTAPGKSFVWIYEDGSALITFFDRGGCMLNYQMGVEEQARDTIRIYGGKGA